MYTYRIEILPGSRPPKSRVLAQRLAAHQIAGSHLRILAKN